MNGLLEDFKKAFGVKENPEGVTHGDAKAVFAIQREIAEEQARYDEDVYKLITAFQRDKAMLDREHAERLLALNERLRAALPQPPTPAE